MQFTARGSELLEGFQAAASVVGPKATREVTRNTKLVVKDGEVGIFASGEETALHYRLSPIEVSTPGEVVLPGETMVGVLREAKEQPTTITVKDNSCEVRFEGSFFRILGEDTTSFPEVMTFDESAAFSVPARLLASSINRTLFAASSEDTRYAMNGVLFVPGDGCLDLVATDGRRLSFVHSKTPGAKALSGAGSDSVIVPRIAVANVLKLLPSAPDAEVRVAISDNRFALQSQNGVLFSRLIDGNFPPYKDVIPKDTTFRVEFDVGSLQAAVRRAALLTDPASKSVRFSFSGDQLSLSSRTADRGEAQINIPVTYTQGSAPEGDDGFVIHFNPDYVGDCLKHVEEDSVSIDFTDPNRQAVMTDGAGLSYVLMPVTPNAA